MAMDGSCIRRGRHGYTSAQNFELWAHQVLGKLPLKKALVSVVLITVLLFLLFQAFGFRESHSKALLISHLGRRHNIRIQTDGGNEEPDGRHGDGLHLISVQLHGRTGNMMFAYASLLGLSKLSARVAVFPDDHYFRTLFKISAGPLRRTGIKSWVRFQEKHACIYDQRLASSGESNADMVELLGYFQSWKYFDHVKDEIRAEFTFQKAVLEESLNRISLAIKSTYGLGARRADITLIGLHVRRGDMSSYSSFRLGYTTASSEYIADAMLYFSQRFNRSNLLFVLCSDDFEWCKDNVKEASSPVVRMEHASDAVHLAILASCNHTIMTVGSFGWWGAWLAGGETVYYKNFPRLSSPLSSDFLPQDYFYPRWVGM